MAWAVNESLYWKGWEHSICSVAVAGCLSSPGAEREVWRIPGDLPGLIFYWLADTQIKCGAQAQKGIVKSHKGRNSDTSNSMDIEFRLLSSLYVWQECL